MALTPRQAAQLKKDLQEINNFRKQINDNPLNIDPNNATAKEIKEIAKSLKEAREFADILSVGFGNVGDDVKAIFGSLTSVVDELKGGKEGIDQAVRSSKKLQTELGKVYDFHQGITDLSEEELKKIQSKVQSELKYLEAAQATLITKSATTEFTERDEIALKNITGILQENSGIYDSINRAITQTREEEEKITKTMGNTGKVAQGLSNVLGKLGLGKGLGLDDAIQSTRKFVKTTEGVTKLGAGKHLLGGIAKNLQAAYGPALALKKMLDIFIQVDNRAVETAQSLGISYKEAVNLNTEMAKVAYNSGNVLLSSEDMRKSQIQLNKEFGTTVKLSNEFVADFALISERTGLSSEAMGMFATQAVIAGNNVKDQLQSISDVTMELNQQSGITLNMKEIQEGISQLSNDQLLTNKMNVKAMANQVFQQKLLGISASQLEQTQSNLLNFESSIGAELEAELLTGKQLNLERARAAALAGDQATLAKEIASQVGTAAEYEKMNVIQREALAKAFGMSRDELAGTLIEQEKMNALRAAGFESASKAQEAYNSLIEEGYSHEAALNQMRLNGQEDLLGSQLKSAGQQEKMAALTEKLTDVFITLGNALMPMIDQMVTFITFIEPVITTLAGAIAGFMIGGPVGAAIGAVAGAGFDLSRASGKNKVNTEVSLATGGIVTKPTRALIGEGGEPEAVVPLSKSQQLGFGSNNETNMLLRELVAAVKQGGHVYIDGAKVGKSLALATSKMG